ncbi:LacI family transcriptional regulator [Agromyces intestinalis]|uniref:LacI family transcriptional regulator n=1 Tax=Agromyces intestinalis TaxID=2592652 RepID=A0A5C1YCJ5_9MICO|nr:LacI family DNA-binding transcriptional regulator [Agromyces intestinalis]QEO13751.1 LacI family transcriptional regulator [Agromyces intestinalis]
MTDGTRSTPATLHDVAREAGVSLATASRALNGSTRKVNEEYRTRVLAAAARLDYSPNLSAQAVARGASTTVALLVADIADPYFSSIAAGVVAEADLERLIVTMAATERDPERELELVRALRGQRPRVMILASSRRTDEPTDGPLAEELAAYERAGGRVVLISRNEYALRTVLLDNRAGAAALATALAGLGYRRFAVVTAGEGLRTAGDRLAGFRDGLAAAGIELRDTDVVRGEFTRDGGYAATTALLERGLNGVEVVFAVNDVMAVGALSAIRDAGLEPGADLAVAGFDDIATVRDVTPPLTTVRVPLEQIGRRALRLALDDADASGPASPATAPDAVPTEVVIRASTPGPRTR